MENSKFETQVGYSGTPLSKKLGIKSGFKVMLVNAPDHYLNLFTDLPPDTIFTQNLTELKDVIHFFVKDKAEYKAKLLQWKRV